MAICNKCGFPKTEIQGVYRDEPKSEDRKICLNCLRKKVEELEEKITNLEKEKKSGKWGKEEE